MTASKNFPNLPANWSEETGFLPNFSKKIFYRILSRKNKMHKRALFIIHGLGEQGDRFTHWPHYLHSCVDAIGLIDLPGHGQSEGTRGHIESFDDYSLAALAGFEFFHEQINQKLGPTELHWLGTSMGGLVTLRTMIHYKNLPLASVIAAEPQLGIAVPVPAIKEFFGVLIEPVLGKIPLSNEINVRLLSHDESVQKKYKENPLNHSKVSPRLYVNMKKEMATVHNFSEAFPYNLCLMVPLADQIVGWKDAFRFFNQLNMQSKRQKELLTFPNFYHELFNELEKGRAFEALQSWILKASKAV